MLRAIAYDPATHCLTLTFHTGAMYDYANVPQSVFDALQNAESKGQYTSENIIDRYPYRLRRR